MLSVTSEAATSVSFQNTRSKPARDDQSPPSDSFGALVDANAQASQAATAQTPSSADPHETRPDRRTDTARPERSAADDDTTQTPSSNALSSQPPRAESAAGPATGFHKSDARTKTSSGNTGHHAGHEGTRVTGDAGSLTRSGASPADPAAAAPQPSASPVAVAVAVPVTTPVATTPSTPAPDTMTAAGSATDATQTAALLLAQQAGTKTATPTTGFDAATQGEATAAATTIAQEARTAAITASAEQASGMQTGFDGEAPAAAMPAAAPAGAKPGTKTQDAAKTPSAAVTGFQSETASADAAAGPASASPQAQQTDAAPGNHKHDDAQAPAGKSSASDSGTPAAQPAASASHAADAPDATQPQTGPTDGSQQPGLTSILAQPQVQSTAAATTAAAPQYNVALAAGAAVPLNGLAVQIAATAQTGKSRFEIRLDPAELGRIDVRLDVDRQGQVTSHLTVEKPETLAMLRQDAPQLQRALQDAGLKTSDGGLQFSLRDQSSSGQNARDDNGRHAQHLIVTEDDIAPAATAGRSYGRMLGSSSGLDIRV